SRCRSSAGRASPPGRERAWGWRVSRNGRYGIFRLGGVDQSALMLASRISLPHFSVSSAISRLNSPDVIDIGSTPKLASRTFMIESAGMALISLLSLSIPSAGVSFGAPPPYHWLASVGRHEFGQGRNIRQPIRA